MASGAEVFRKVLGVCGAADAAAALRGVADLALCRYLVEPPGSSPPAPHEG